MVSFSRNEQLDPEYMQNPEAGRVTGPQSVDEIHVDTHSRIDRLVPQTGEVPGYHEARKELMVKPEYVPAVVAPATTPAAPVAMMEKTDAPISQPQSKDKNPINAVSTGALLYTLPPFAANMGTLGALSFLPGGAPLAPAAAVGLAIPAAGAVAGGLVGKMFKRPKTGAAIGAATGILGTSATLATWGGVQGGLSMGAAALHAAPAVLTSATTLGTGALIGGGMYALGRVAERATGTKNKSALETMLWPITIPYKWVKQEKVS